MQPPLYKFINLPYRPDTVKMEATMDGVTVEAIGSDVSDATEKVASELIRAIALKYTRFLYLYFNFSEVNKPLNMAHLEDFVKKNSMRRQFHYDLGDSGMSNALQEVTCMISLSCSDTNRDKAAAQILFNFQQIYSL